MRHERELVAREVPTCPPLESVPAKNAGRWNEERTLRVAAEVVELSGDALLGVTVFDEEGRPECRAWMSAEQHGLQVFRDISRSYYGTKRKPGRMYGARLDSVYDGIPSGRQKLIAEAETEKTIRAFLANPVQTELGRALARYVATQDERVRELRKEREREEIRARFGVIEDAPAAFDAWVKDEVFRDMRYLFYEEARKKDSWATCSYCGERVPIRAPYGEGKPGACPNCGSACTYRSGKRQAYGRGILKTRYAATWERHGGELLVRSYQVRINIPGGAARPVAQIHRGELFRHFVSMRTGNVAAEFSAMVRKSVSVDGFSRCEGEGILNARLWPEGLKELREDTALRYMPLETLYARGAESDPVELWKNAMAAPEAEYLIKQGFWRLAEWRLKRRYVSGYGILNVGKKPWEVLGVAREDVSILREADVEPYSLGLFRELKRAGHRVSAEQLRQIGRLGLSRGNLESLLAMCEHLSLGKALRYLESFGDDGANTLQTWKDYRRMAAGLGMDLSDGTLLFPKNLKKAHDEAVKAGELKKNEKLAKAVARTGKRLNGLCWSFDGLSIRPAISREELWDEGQALHHCVGRAGYAEKMAKGQTAIFFIRRAKKPEEPYVTLELDLKEMRCLQCCGVRDSSPGPQVKAFWERWLSDIVRKERVSA